MQTILTTKSAIFSAAFTCDMLKEVATKYLGYSQEATDKLATQSVSKATKHLEALDCQKLRTVIVQKLEQSADFGDTFKTNELELEYDCLPDLNMDNAGKNSRRAGGGRKAVGGELKGAYTVVKRGATSTAESDPAKFALWEIIWNSTTFEEVFAKADKKYITRTGRIVTPSSSLRWALKSGWIVPVAA